MPKFEPKQIQKELEGGKVWPVYWIYGTEAMKSRELLKRIKTAVLGESGEGASNALFASAFNEAILDGAEVSSADVLDAAQSLSLGGGARFVFVKQAHLLKDTEVLSALFGPAGPKTEVPSVTVFLSKDLDQRKKFSKQLVEKAAVIACEEVSDADREPWVLYLAKRKGMTLTEQAVARLRAMDPWSLDMVERELEKWELASMGVAEGEGADEILLSGVSDEGVTERFVEHFFLRDRKGALELVDRFADQPDLALPLLGLLSWNTRMLASVLKDQEQRTRETKLGGFLAERFSRYAREWKISEVANLQSKLCEVDFGTKQTSRPPLGLWADLTLSFGR